LKIKLCQTAVTGNSSTVSALNNHYVRFLSVFIQRNIECGYQCINIIFFMYR